MDRGAWGLETVTLLLLMKLAMPAYVHLLRGNHGELQYQYAITLYQVRGEDAVLIIHEPCT